MISYNEAYKEAIDYFNKQKFKIKSIRENDEDWFFTGYNPQYGSLPLIGGVTTISINKHTGDVKPFIMLELNNRLIFSEAKIVENNEISIEHFLNLLESQLLEKLQDIIYFNDTNYKNKISQYLKNKYSSIDQKLIKNTTEYNMEVVLKETLEKEVKEFSSKKINEIL